MAESNENAALETETGFGTGLRTHLRRHSDAPADASDPAAETVPAADVSSDPAEDQLRAELEDVRDREEVLRAALADQVDAYERMLDLERHLAVRSEELEERERRVAKQLEWIQTETWRLGDLRGQLEPAPQAEEAAPSETATPVPGPARAHLRRKLEEDAERVWRVFASGLEATTADGTPDFHTRLVAVTTLLAEAYGESPAPAHELPDELADLRARRARKP